MAERTTQPYAAVPLDQLRVDAYATVLDQMKVAVVEDTDGRVTIAQHNLSPRCACPDPIAVIVSTGPVLCQACGRRCG